MLGVPQLDGYHAQRVHPYQAAKAYRCPGCGNAIAVGVGHVVAWPDGEPDWRRHWHRHCWRLAVNRGRIA